MHEGTATTRHAIPPGRHIVPRPRLLEVLERSEARIVLLVAPAGYGKTTLIGEWVTGKSSPFAWFSASDASVDVAALALGLARAAASVLPSVDAVLRQRLSSARESAPNADVLLDLLATSLKKWPRDAWLVIDDYQALASSDAAEAFVGGIAELRHLNLIIASRRRPAWATARRLLYGEIGEIGRAALAMTTEEASRVLAGRRSAREVEGLAALADGWPAVIGLAALSGSEIGELGGDVPETLHDFFAQELLNAFPADLRTRLLRLAMPATLSAQTIELIGGPDAARLRAEGSRHGFLAAGPASDLEMHPLLRRFLLARLDRQDPETRRTVAELGSALIEAKQWDDAFALAEGFGADDLLPPLIQTALDDLLASGRITTVRRWVEHALLHDLTCPELDLARSEIAFREGRYSDAQELALSAAATFEPQHRLLARASFRAAQSAHLDDRVEEALDLHKNAAAHAGNSRDRQDALWGQFISQSELDLIDDARETLKRFRRARRTPEDVLREAQARISLGIRWDGLNRTLLQPSDQARLLEMHADPVVKSAFLQMLGCALSLHSDYERAVDVSDRSLAIADEFRLDFVLPHAYYVRATALIGIRQLGEAQTIIRRSEKFAKALDDQHSLINSLIVRARIALTKRRPEDAVGILDVKPKTWPTPGLGGEFHGIRAIAYACLGDTGAARRVADGGLNLSQQLESEIPTMWARVLAAREADRSELAIRALRRTEDVGHLDTFVLAYRSEPALLTGLARAPELRTSLEAILERASDHAIARRIGIPLTPATSRRSLTQREAEVLDLLRQGLTNAEISRALWISEATAKVHVRHVLEKLGVRTRLQAATATFPDDY
jgi:ATP/maltotriose-dependent transcriptional regulator MalT